MKDSTSGRERSSWSFTDKLVLFLLAAGLLSSLPFTVHPWYDATNDGSVYISTAQSLASGDGYSFLGMPFRERPPGFSALLAPIIAWKGVDFFAFNMLVSLFGCAGVILLYVHQRAYVGWALALLTSLALWLNPGYQRLCNQVMSDVLGLALILAIVIVQRWATPLPHWRRELLLGLSIGLAAYARFACILMVPAILAARIVWRFRRGTEREQLTSFVPKRLVLFALIAFLVQLPWSGESREGTPPQLSDQMLNHSISTAMWHTVANDPTSRRYTAKELLHRVPDQVLDVGVALGRRMQTNLTNGQRGKILRAGGNALIKPLLLATWMVLCLLIVLFRRPDPAEFFALGLLSVIAFYFVFVDRLILPIYVFGLAATVQVTHDLLRRITGSRRTTILMSVALLMLIAWDFTPRANWDQIERRHNDWVDMASAVNPILLSDARVGTRKGLFYGTYLDQPVYTLRRAMADTLVYETVEQIIDKQNLNTIVLDPEEHLDSSYITYFTEHYGPGSSAGSVLVWRIR